MASTSKMKLFDSDDEDSDPQDCNITINKDYAEKYDVWRAKEELQKLKAKYPDVTDSSSSSEEEDDNADLWTADVDRNWFRAYSALMFKDPRIYDKNYKFFDNSKAEEEEEDSDTDSSSSEKKSPKKKKKKKEEKPLTVKDHERRLITERSGVVSESDDDEDKMAEPQSLGYYEEQEAIRKSIKNAVADMSSDEEDDDILKHRPRTKKEKEDDEEEYLQFLRGEKEIEDMTTQDKELAKELAPLRDFYNRPDVTEDEKFMWNYMVNKRHRFENSDDEAEVDDDVLADLEEDEEFLEEQEHHETVYNFRFEEPDKNFIKQYKRNPEDSIRQETNKRAQKRKETKERKKKAMEERREEIRLLKRLKRQEKESRLERLMKECPSGVNFSVDDLKGDFNPKAYDRMMKKKFQDMDEKDDDDDDDEKPDLKDLEDILSIDSHEDLLGDLDKSDTAETAETLSFGEGVEEEEEHGSKFNMDADFDPSCLVGDQARSSRSRRRHKKSKLQQALGTDKPSFSEVKERYAGSATAFEDYVGDHYNLDYREYGFRYRNVVANDFGLDPTEMLWLPARELNAWVSMKSIMEQKTEEEELYDKRKYQSSKLQKKMLNVMPSLKKIDNEEYGYEDIRPSTLRQQRQEQQASLRNDSDSDDDFDSQTPADDDLGVAFNVDTEQTIKRKRKAEKDISIKPNISPGKKRKSEMDASEETPRKKKKKVKDSRLSNSQQVEGSDSLNHGEEGKKKKKKKKLNTTGETANDTLNSDLQTEKKKKKKLNTTMDRTVHETTNHDPQSVKKKKKKTTDERTENKPETNEGKQRKKKKKKLASEGDLDTGDQLPSKTKKTKKDNGNISENQTEEEKSPKKKVKKLKGEPTMAEKGSKKMMKGKKQKKKGGKADRKGYNPLHHMKADRLAAFHIDPKKFKYIKDRLVPTQPLPE